MRVQALGSSRCTVEPQRMCRVDAVVSVHNFVVSSVQNGNLQSAHHPVFVAVDASECYCKDGGRYLADHPGTSILQAVLHPSLVHNLSHVGRAAEL
mgnify:CR=1 FL=1